MWTQKVEEAQKDGVCIVECTLANRFVSAGYVDPKNHNFVYGYPNEPQSKRGTKPYDLVYAPNSIRTVAESYDNHEFSYAYWGVGGLSWAIPYVVGVLALGQQVNPTLDARQLKQLLIETAQQNAGVINPKTFIKKAKETKSQKKYSRHKKKRLGKT